MSHLLIRGLYRAQAARSLTGRLLSTCSVVNNRTTHASERNYPGVADSIRTQRIFESDHLRESDVRSNKLENLLSNTILWTGDIASPIRVESSNTKHLEDGRDKVLSAKDVVVDRENKASLDELNKVADHLARHLPYFFSSAHPFFLYSKDVVFIDKTRNIRTQGIWFYMMHIAFVKGYYTLNFANSRLELLNLVKDPEESSIKIRWRFVSKPGFVRLLLTFYKYHGTQVWRDAISTIYVNKEGKIYCHVCDNIDVEKEGAKVKKLVKNPLINREINV